jgi:mono/diheme cytochrome c family protein
MGELRVPVLVLAGMIGMTIGPLCPAVAQQATTTPQNQTPQAQTIDVEQLFANTCGWCHSGGGRAPGKGPQLMGTQRTDDFMRNRIRNGKEGAMPAFGQMLSDADVDAVIKYIHALKPEQG